jgi:hypothetical protein
VAKEVKALERIVDALFADTENGLQGKFLIPMFFLFLR